MAEMKISFDFAIDLLEEAVAYETLFALKGTTEKRLEKQFPSYNNGGLLNEGIVTPSQILKKEASHGREQEIENIYSKVKQFIKSKNMAFSVCTQKDFHYPTSLRKSQLPLKLFYYKGDIGLLESPCVSVVGARQASNEGLMRAERIVKLLVKNNITVVSGLARGVDTKALETAIALGGKTVAVIGTPIDQYYPKENKLLQDDIAKNHLLISQVPFYRYAHEHYNAHRFYFPKRNITMASLSKCSIIVEASETSGTLTQAKAVLKEQRKLLILDSCFQRCQWPFEFEEKGAIRVRREEDVLAHISFSE